MGRVSSAVREAIFSKSGYCWTWSSGSAILDHDLDWLVLGGREIDEN